ncbi:MAG: hypothetical protein ACHQJ6_05210 [Candidatus Berkiellales bacterium]
MQTQFWGMGNHGERLIKECQAKGRPLKRVNSFALKHEIDGNGLVVLTPVPPTFWTSNRVKHRLIPMDDFRGNLNLALLKAEVDETIADIQDEEGNIVGTVVSHCKAGKGRSFTFDVCLLLIMTDMNVMEILVLMIEKRPQVSPSEDQLQLIERFIEAYCPEKGPIDRKSKEFQPYTIKWWDPAKNLEAVRSWWKGTPKQNPSSHVQSSADMLEEDWVLLANSLNGKTPAEISKILGEQDLPAFTNPEGNLRFTVLSNPDGRPLDELKALLAPRSEEKEEEEEKEVKEHNTSAEPAEKKASGKKAKTSPEKPARRVKEVKTSEEIREEALEKQHTPVLAKMRKIDDGTKVEPKGKSRDKKIEPADEKPIYGAKRGRDRDPVEETSGRVEGALPAKRVRKH